MQFKRRGVVASLTVLVLAAIGLAIGCDRSPKSRPKASRQASGARQDRFEDAFELLDGDFQIGSDEAYLRASFYVNEWLAQQSVTPDQWTRDPLVDRLPVDSRQLSDLANLERMEVDTNDMRHLEFVLLVRQLGDWVTRQASPATLARWLSESSLDEVERVELARADRLFDWTIRNIQLEIVPKAANARPGQAIQAWAGAWLLPRDVLFYGRGDSWQRGAVFIELCRQQNLSAVMLAVAEDSNASDPVPWLPAVRIGEQLYLFDTALGVPVPTADGRGIATLGQVADNPSMLDVMSVAGLFTYPVGPEQLQRLNALVAASPENMSARMKIIEGRLTGKHRLVLHASISDEATRLKSHPQIKRVLPWAWAARRNEESRATERRLKREPQQMAQMTMELLSLPFQSDNPLVRGRRLHLRGMFDNLEDGTPGAKALYMETRVPKAKLERIATDIETQRELGLTRAPGEHDTDWQVRVAATTYFVIQSLHHSSFWLALIQYEQGNFESAEGWLVKRNLEAYPDGPWKRWLRYNVARTLEALGRVDEARSIYLSEEGPQRHGNLIRARLLQTTAQATKESSDP